MGFILENLPGVVSTILNEMKAIKYAEETSENSFNLISSTSADSIFRQLGGTDVKSIGIICDASFCSPFVKHLITNKVGKVFIIKNREGEMIADQIHHLIEI